MAFSGVTAKIYANKPAAQKRLIMSELFHSISASGNVVSVKLTKLAQAIAEKSQETNDKLNDLKNDERKTKNDPDNRGGEGHSDIENELQSSWLAT